MHAASSGGPANPRELEVVNDALATYLHNYTALSLNLFGRWPAFVPAEEQDLERLQDVSSFCVGPPIPRDLQELPPPPHPGWGRPLTLAEQGGDSFHSSRRGSHTLAELGDLSSSPRRGSRAIAAIGAGAGEALPSPRRRPSSSLAPPSFAPRRASAVSSSTAGDDRTLTSEVVAEAEAREAVLREQMDRMADKIRIEASRRNSAADDALNKSMDLAAARAHIGKLEERQKALNDQLEHERVRTLSLEGRLRETQAAKRNSDTKATSERKQRFRLEVRLERLDKSIEPLRQESERRGVAMRQADAACRLVEKAQFAADARADALAAENVSLQSRLMAAHRRYEETAEKLAGSLSAAEAAAQAKEEAEEEREEARGKAKELRAALHTAEATIAEARAAEGRARQAEAAAAGEAAAALAELAESRHEAGELRASEFMARAAAEGSQERMDRMRREAEYAKEQQSGLFGVVSELLSRVLYFRTLPPEVLGMGRAEMARHETEAIRHIQAIRDASIRDNLATDVVCAPPTVAAGAAVLKAAVTAAGVLPIDDWDPPEGVFLSRVEQVGRLPGRARVAQPAGSGGASLRASPRALAVTPRAARGAGDMNVSGGSPRGGAGRVRSSIDAAGEAGDPTSASATPIQSPQPNTGRTNRSVVSGGGTLLVAPPRGARSTPRGPRAKKVAGAGAGELLESTEWERNKLLELMERTEVERVEA